MNRRIAKKKFKQYIDNIVTANSGDIIIIRLKPESYTNGLRSNMIAYNYLRKLAIKKNIKIYVLPWYTNTTIIDHHTNDISVNKVSYIFDRIISLYKEDNKDKIDSIYNQL